MMEQIKQLRNSTGAGIVDCKKALAEADGDLEKATEILRKKGIAKAAKRGDRETTEGVIKLSVSNDTKTGYIIQINSETDFVAKNEKFQEFGDKVLEIAKNNNPKTLEDLLALKMDDNTVKENLETFSGVIGEKLDIKDYKKISSEGTVGFYSHMGGKIGALVAIDKADSAELANDIAMHVAAANPRYITSDEVPLEETDKEKEIYREQLLKEGKPENIIDNILMGKIKKYYSEVCLVDQEFIKEDKKKVSEILGDAKVSEMVRFSLV